MKIEFDKPDLTKEYVEAIINKRRNGNIDVTNIINRINHYYSKIDDMNLITVLSMSDKIFYTILSDLANIKLDRNDEMNILSLMNNKNYTHTHLINTTMLAHRKVPTTVSYLITADEDVIIDENHLYTASELSQLIDRKDLVILDKIYNTKDITIPSKSELEFGFEVYNSKRFLNEKDSLYLYTLKYIRKIVSNELIDEAKRKYKEDLNSEIDYVINFNNEDDSKEVSDELRKILK